MQTDRVDTHSLKLGLDTHTRAHKNPADPAGVSQVYKSFKAWLTEASWGLECFCFTWQETAFVSPQGRCQRWKDVLYNQKHWCVFSPNCRQIASNKILLILLQAQSQNCSCKCNTRSFGAVLISGTLTVTTDMCVVVSVMRALAGRLWRGGLESFSVANLATF